jgi:amino acid transporter
MPYYPALKRALGFRDLTLFYVVSGLSVRWVASAAAGGPSTLVFWVIALVGFFIPLAASVLELSSRYPREAVFTSGRGRPSATSLALLPPGPTG